MGYRPDSPFFLVLTSFNVGLNAELNFNSN